MAKYRITITLEYDTDPMGEYPRDVKWSEDRIEEMVYDDLIDLMRGDRLSTWADIEEM